MRMRTLSIALCLTLIASGCSSVFKQDYDGNGTNATRTEVAAVEAKETFAFEAEAGLVVPRDANTWEAINDQNTSGSKMILKAGDNFYGEAKQGPGIVWTYAAASKGAYDIWIRVKPNVSGDSLFSEWAGDSLEHHWAAESLDKWVWTKLRTVEVLADQGYEFAVWAREDQIEVDLMVIQTAGATEPKAPN